MIPMPWSSASRCCDADPYSAISCIRVVSLVLYQCSSSIRTDLTDNLYQFDSEYSWTAAARFGASLRLHLRNRRPARTIVKAERSEFILSLDTRSQPAAGTLEQANRA